MRNSSEKQATVIEIPNFNTEAEEAAWWDSPEGRKATLNAFEQSVENGTLGRGTSKKRIAAQLQSDLIACELKAVNRLRKFDRGDESIYLNVDAVIAVAPGGSPTITKIAMANDVTYFIDGSVEDAVRIIEG